MFRLLEIKIGPKSWSKFMEDTRNCTIVIATIQEAGL